MLDLYDVNVKKEPDTNITIEVDGKERTVYNSNGKRIAKSKEALTNFWRWFGDSKVVDERGRPHFLDYVKELNGSKPTNTELEPFFSQIKKNGKLTSSPLLFA